MFLLETLGLGGASWTIRLLARQNATLIASSGKSSNLSKLWTSRTRWTEWFWGSKAGKHLTAFY